MPNKGKNSLEMLGAYEKKKFRLAGSYDSSILKTNGRKKKRKKFFINAFTLI